MAAPASLLPSGTKTAIALRLAGSFAATSREIFVLVGIMLRSIETKCGFGHFRRASPILRGIDNPLPNLLFSLCPYMQRRGPGVVTTGAAAMPQTRGRAMAVKYLYTQCKF